MSFLTIIPRDNIYLTQSIGPIPLRITRNGVDTTPDDNITITNLNTKDNWKYKHFYNTGDGGITFKVEVVIKDTDVITTLNGDPIYGDDFKVLTALKYFKNNQRVLTITTDAIDVPNDTYIITKNSSRKQTHDHNTVWELEFTTYKGITTYKFNHDTSDVKASVAATKNAKLKKCNYKKLKYSKKKKVVKCVKYMQKVLYKNKLLKKKQITGWFDKTTKKAVKKFQKKWNKKHVKAKTTNTVNSTLVTVNAGSLVTDTSNSNISLPAGTTLSTANTNTGSTTVKITGMNKLLRTDGKVDKATWKALCES